MIGQEIQILKPDERIREAFDQTMGSKGAGTDDLCPDLSPLDTMSHGELVSLCRRVCAARWGEVAGLTEEDAYEAASLKMLHGGLTEKEINKALPSLREWMDRKRGKPKQVVEQTIDQTITVDITARRAEAEQEASEMLRIVGERTIVGVR